MRYCLIVLAICVACEPLRARLVSGRVPPVTSSPRCPGSEHGGSSGVIKSPNFPGNYFYNLDCYYRIAVSDSRKAVQLTFSAFNTEHGDDYVDIFDGFGPEANLIVNLTGRSIDLSTSYKSSTNEMLVHFHTDRGISYRGWSANYAEAVPSTPSSPDCQSSEYYSGSSGTIHSPNFPASYVNRLDCYYRITLNNWHKTVKLTFTAFNTENRYDYMEVFDGLEPNANLIVKLTGESVDLSKTYKGTTNKMLLHFRTDGSRLSSGWSVNYAEA